MDSNPPLQTTGINNLWLQGLFFPPFRADLVWPSPGIFQENKSAPPTKATRPKRRGTQLPSALQARPLTKASFKAPSAWVKHDTSPATRQSQFIRPAIKMKRRMHGGEGTKDEKYFIPKPPQKKRGTPGPVNSWGSTKPVSTQAITGQVLP